jgi:hypothetical protein
MIVMTEEMLELIAQRFRLLADLIRLRVLHELQHLNLTYVASSQAFEGRKWFISVLDLFILLACAKRYATA